MADFHFSIFNPATWGEADHSALVGILDSALSGMGLTDRWKVTTDGFWCCATPDEYVERSQGWKLHVSATMATAETVLAQSLPVLLKSHSAFKFARTIEHVIHLNARHTPRGHSGKFITVYPHSDDIRPPQVWLALAFSPIVPTRQAAWFTTGMAVSWNSGSSRMTVCTPG
jgi:hypothetical protein